MTGLTISCLPWRIVPSLSTCHGEDCLPSSCRGVRDWLLSTCPGWGDSLLSTSHGRWKWILPTCYGGRDCLLYICLLTSCHGGGNLSPDYLSWRRNLSLDYLSWRRRLFVISRKTILSPWEKYPVSIMSITCNENCDNQNNYSKAMPTAGTFKIMLIVSNEDNVLHPVIKVIPCKHL
jgi:hypothetical protein